jgi:hypothetical protein
MFRIEPAELGGDHIGQASAEIVLLGVTTKIGKREDDEANFVAPENCGPKPAVHAKGKGTENPESKYGGNNALPYRGSLD